MVVEWDLMGKPIGKWWLNGISWENHRKMVVEWDFMGKPIGKWWLNGISWENP